MASAAAASATYIQPGRYRFEVQAIKARDGFKGTSAIVELKVISSAPNGSAGTTHADVAAPARVAAPVAPSTPAVSLADFGDLD